MLTDAVDTLNVRHARAGSEKDEARSQRVPCEFCERFRQLQ